MLFRIPVSPSPLGRAAFFAMALMTGSVSAVYADAPAPIVNVLKRPAEDPGWQKNPLNFIAHAGGAIDGNRYVNSVEAVQKSIDNGYRLIELDLLETSDGHFIAAHSWKEYKAACGMQGPVSDRPLTLAQAKECRLSGRYTPLVEERINEIFTSNPSLFLVTDKTANFEKLQKSFRQFADRLLVEVKGFAKFKEAVAAGIQNPMLATNLEKLPENFFTDNNVRFIVIKKKTLTRNYAELVELRKRGMEIFVATTDDTDFIGKYIGKAATAFYADGWDLKKGGCFEGCFE